MAVRINEQFISRLRRLIRDVYDRSSNDPIIYRTKERVFALCDINPSKVIDRVGTVLFRYRDDIINGGDAFFYLDLRNDVTMDNFNDFDYVNKKIGVVYQTLDSEEREVYRDDIYEMLELYIDYETTRSSEKS